MGHIQNFFRCQEEGEEEGEVKPRAVAEGGGWTFDVNQVAATSAQQGGGRVTSSLLELSHRQ